MMRSEPDRGPTPLRAGAMGGTWALTRDRPTPLRSCPVGGFWARPVT